MLQEASKTATPSKPWSLLLEDDAYVDDEARVIQEKYVRGITWLMRNEPAKVKLIYLGGKFDFPMKPNRASEVCNEVRPPKKRKRPVQEAAYVASQKDYKAPFSGILVPGQNTMQGHAYMIHKDGIPTVQQYLAKGYSGDIALLHAAREWGPGSTWRFKPNLIKQPKNESDTRPKA